MKKISIAFDGPEGCGSQVQARLLRCRLAQEFPDLKAGEVEVLDRSILTDLVSKPGLEVEAGQAADYIFFLAIGREPERFNGDFYLAVAEARHLFPEHRNIYTLLDHKNEMTPEGMHARAWEALEEPVTEWYRCTHSQTAEGAGRPQKERV